MSGFSHWFHKFAAVAGAVLVFVPQVTEVLPSATAKAVTSAAGFLMGLLATAGRVFGSDQPK